MIPLCPRILEKVIPKGMTFSYLWFAEFVNPAQQIPHSQSSPKTVTAGNGVLKEGNMGRKESPDSEKDADCAEQGKGQPGMQTADLFLLKCFRLHPKGGGCSKEKDGNICPMGGYAQYARVGVVSHRTQDQSQ